MGGNAEYPPQLFWNLLKLTTVHIFLQKEKCSEFSMCSFPLSLSSALEFVHDHQQVPAMKSLIANGFVFVVIVIQPFLITCNSNCIEKLNPILCNLEQTITVSTPRRQKKTSVTKPKLGPFLGRVKKKRVYSSCE